MIVITDQVLAAIGEHIATHEPERGGALLGMPNTNVICSFIPDPGATVSHSSYQPSADLGVRVRGEEQQHGLQFFGLVHSHPGSYAEQSRQDYDSFLNALDANPHLSAFFAPIVTVDRSARESETRCFSLAPRGRLTPYIAYRPKRAPEELHDHPDYGHARSIYRRSAFQHRGHRPFSAPTVIPAQCSVMPVEAHFSSVAMGLTRHAETITRRNAYLELAGALFLSETFVARHFEIAVLLPPTFPFTRPIVLYTPLHASSADTVELGFDWPFTRNLNTSLWDVLRYAVAEKLARLPLAEGHHNAEPSWEGGMA